MKRRRRVVEVDPEQLESTGPAVWLTEQERERLVGLVDEARAVHVSGSPVRTGLAGAAPGIWHPAVLIADRAAALRRVEGGVVAYRRRQAGWRYWRVSGEQREDVVARFQLGHLSRPA
ncbi:hypothetical protein ACQP04_28110 [Pseudonocardia halophobica]|uniref:hypothetical protein n=1 Tax=Pseudonocardia halophobica TaxID=29401 RepID=UPI003D90422C